MIINASNIVAEFSAANQNAIVQAQPLGELLYRGFFPLQYNTDLNFSNIEGMTGAKVMANVVAQGSKAPRKGRSFTDSIKGEIPKIEIARDLNEFDLFKIQQLRNAVSANPSNSGIKNQLIDKIYGDSPFVIDGVNARLEFLSKRAASTGKIDFTLANNAIGIQNVNIDFGVTIQNAVKVWSDATADPIQDLINAQEAALGQGYRISYATTDQLTANSITKLQKAKEFVYGVAQGGSAVLFEPTLEQLNQKLADKRLPQIRVWESFVSEEGKDGNLTSMNGWQLGNIVMTAESIFGSTQYTTSPEFGMNFGDTVSQSVKDDFILVKTFGVQDPILVSTKATAFALPVLNNTRQTRILKTLA
jgi:hypothetical protein